MATEEEVHENLTSGGLILYDAVSFYELLCRSEPDLTPVQQLHRQSGNWKQAFTEAFEAGYDKGYTNIFGPAIGVIDNIPSGPDVENALENIEKASQYVVSRAGLLKQDLSGRIYHSALGKTLAKRFATYYTRIPSSDLLAWLAVEEWDDKVIDFASGSGALLNGAYSRKLSLALPDAIDEDNEIDSLNDIHRQFIESDIYGLDAMGFASHLTMVNLAMQRPDGRFESSNVYQVPVTNPRNGESRTGSLELLASNTLRVQERFSGESVGAVEASSLGSGMCQATINKDFDVVIMNPPFTEKSRATEILDMSKVNEMVREHDADLTGQTGLAAPFVRLGDLHLKPGGRLALVLPTSVVDRYSWEPVREMLSENYNIEHMVVSWAPGMPAWSEKTERREILLVARKLKDGENGGLKNTVVSHIDTDIDFSEAREVSQVLDSTDPKNISIRSPNAQVLFSGTKPLGMSKSYPAALLNNHTDNWYRYAAFRNADMTKLMLSLEGILSANEAPYGVSLENGMTSPISDCADVLLFLKNIKSAGYRVVDDEPSDTVSDWTVNTSSINKIHLEEDDVQWVYKDPGLEVTEPFDYNTGDLLIPGFSKDFYHSMYVVAAVPEKRATGSVWFPVTVPEMETEDGKTITADEAAKVLGAWINSVLGIVPVLGYRAEVRGARTDYKTNQLRNITTINPNHLTREQVDGMLDAYNEVVGTEWELLRIQFENALEDDDHPRRRLDEKVCEALMDERPDIDALESDFLEELNKLGRIMNG